jgi:hypothetical protein
MNRSACRYIENGKQLNQKTMAKVTDVFVSGSIGNITFYRRMGTQCARVKRTQIAQSPAMKIRSANFGIAARAGKTLRTGLTASMPNATDRSMQSRFSGAISKWLGTSGIDELPSTNAIPFLSALEFTKEQPVRQRFRVPLTISLPQANVVTVSIDPFVPSKQIVAPAGTKLVTLVISVSGCLLKTGKPTGSETHTIDIPYTDTTVAAQELEFQVKTPSQSLVVSAAQLIYKRFEYNTWVNINKEAFVPAGVIDARYVG